MVETSTLSAFAPEQLEIFARADAMCGMSFPYMGQASAQKPKKFSRLRQWFGFAAGLFL